MPNPTLSEAIAEAYASAPASVIYHTIEIRHSTLTEPIRLVLGNDNIEARLESSAPQNAGEIVTFIRYYFRFQQPSVNPDGPPTITISIDNVDRSITSALEVAVRTPDPIKISYREYLHHNLSSGPENDPAATMEVLDVNVNLLTAECTCGYREIINRKFPTMEYTSEMWPGLVGE